MPKLIRANYNKHKHGEEDIYRWLKSSCQARFYMGPSYLDYGFVEFEDDQDALLFQLTWTST